MSKLLKPIQIGSLNLNNRLVMPPMATAKSPDGVVNDDVLNYYDEKSKDGHIGLIIIEHAYITQKGRAHKNQLSIGDDCDIEKLKSLSDIIHKNNSKAVMQINHAGFQTTQEATGYPLVSVSSAPHPRTKVVGNTLSLDEINDIIENFKEAALRVKEANFDGVEIHSAHGYLLNQFFSPLTNKREDLYGGSLENRIRIHIQIIKAIRSVVGCDFPILLRLGACDYTDGGTTVEDSIFASKEFEKAGVDILDISGGFNGYSVPNSNEEGYFSNLTKAIKENISIPVILTGGITTPLACEELLKKDKADLIGVGRAILKDSNWAKNCIEELK